MEDSCQSCSIHVYVFLQREVGVNSGHSDQLALAESGLLTLDSCWAVLPINLLGLSWSWCSVLSSSAAKHTATFTLQLQLSVSLGVSLHLTVTSADLIHTDWMGSSSPYGISSFFNFTMQEKVSGLWAKGCDCHLFLKDVRFRLRRCASGSLLDVYFPCNKITVLGHPTYKGMTLTESIKHLSKHIYSLENVSSHVLDFTNYFKSIQVKFAFEALFPADLSV